MPIKQHIWEHYNGKKEKKREIGRYFCSEIWSMYKGYLTPSKFFENKLIDKQGQAMIFRGEAMELKLNQLLLEEGVKFETQVRMELKIDDFTISGKTDFTFPTYILETKCPDKIIYEIPDKWKMQMELYYRMSGLPVYLGIFAKDGNEIIRFYKYKPDAELYKTIIDTVTKFHLKLKKKSLKVTK